MNSLMDINKLQEIAGNNVMAINGITLALGTIKDEIKTQGAKIDDLGDQIKAIIDVFETSKRDELVGPADLDRITNAKKRRIVTLLGGKNSSAYKNASLRSKCYADIDSYMKEPFGVTSYKFIRHIDTDKVINRINYYEFPRGIRESVYNENAQMSFNL